MIRTLVGKDGYPCSITRWYDGKAFVQVGFDGYKLHFLKLYEDKNGKYFNLYGKKYYYN